MNPAMKSFQGKTWLSKSEEKGKNLVDGQGVRTRPEHRDGED